MSGRRLGGRRLTSGDVLGDFLRDALPGHVHREALSGPPGRALSRQIARPYGRTRGRTAVLGGRRVLLAGLTAVQALVLTDARPDPVGGIRTGTREGALAAGPWGDRRPRAPSAFLWRCFLWLGSPPGRSEPVARARPYSALRASAHSWSRRRRAPSAHSPLQGTNLSPARCAVPLKRGESIASQPPRSTARAAPPPAGVSARPGRSPAPPHPWPCRPGGHPPAPRPPEAADHTQQTGYATQAEGDSRPKEHGPNGAPRRQASALLDRDEVPLHHTRGRADPGDTPRTPGHLKPPTTPSKPATPPKPKATAAKDTDRAAPPPAGVSAPRPG